MPLLSTYMIKPNRIKNARCVCNSSSHIKGAITLGKTYVAALEQSGCHLFWYLSVLENFVIYGANTINTYAEAPALVEKL